MFTINLQIPAKALLFGEYGLLYDGKALVCILPNLFFEIQIDVSDQSLTAGANITVISNFFEKGKLEFTFSETDKKNTVSHTNNAERDLSNHFQKHLHFFYQALLPWAEYLKNCKLTINIKKSFPPDLGFGSSSAIIAAITYALFVFIYKKKPNMKDEFLWKKIRNSLQNAQGLASGYDVGVQLAYLIEKRRFWIYQNQNNHVVPKIEPSFNINSISQLGCFIKTKIYSDTKKALKKFSDLDEDEKSFFANEHKKIAEAFLKTPNFSTLQTGMNDSLKLAQKQGIHVKNELTEKLKEQHISYKTMGSGYGDCLWVAESRENLLNLGLILEDDIAFDFVEIVN